MINKQNIVTAVCLLLFLAGTTTFLSAQKNTAAIGEQFYENLEWRNIGPDRDRPVDLHRLDVAGRPRVSAEPRHRGPRTSEAASVRAALWPRFASAI